MELTEFLFEKYTNHNVNKVFLGYKSVLATNKEEAYRKALEKLDENIVLFPIANPRYF